jgi:hypothetical protein
MKSSNKSRKPITAAELMNQLNEDPEFMRRKQERDKHFAALEKAFTEAEKPVVDALNDVVGISVKSVWELVNTATVYPNAIPVLVSHLRYQYPYRVREAIARALTVNYAGEDAYRALVREYKNCPESEDPAQHGFKWALGNAISVVSTGEDFDEIVELVRDKRHRSSRDTMVLRLAKLKPDRSVDVLIDLLSDDEVAGFAVIALGRLKATKASAQIGNLRRHPSAWVRKEALRALEKIKG